MAKFSVKRPYTVLVVVLALIVLGIVSFTKMTTDFLPELEFPYLIAITTYPGASPQRVEAEVTDPLEGALSTVNGVHEVTSTSSENYSQIFLEFEENTNMDSAMVKVTSAINQIDLPESCGDPILMEISADMMPVLYTSVGYGDLEGSELSEFVKDNILPRLQREDGVASITTSGIVEESVEIRLSQEKIDSINEDIAEMTDEKLSEAGAEIANARNQLDSAQASLAQQQASLSSTQNETTAQLAQYTQMMNQAIATKAAYDSQVTSLNAYKTALTTELNAYTSGDNNVQTSYDMINNGFTTARNGLSDQIASLEAQRDLLPEGETRTAVDTQIAALNATLDKLPTDISDAIANPDKLAAFNTLMQQTNPDYDASSLTIEKLTQVNNIVNVRIPQINTELANLETEIAAAEAASNEVNAQIQEATDNYTNVEQQKMSAIAAFGAGSASITSGEQTIESSRADLDEAEESYENSRRQALENANINALLSMSALSQLLSAQNFSMPLGYVNDDKTQYLLKIDEEESSVEGIKSMPLTSVDGIGTITVDDVADITVIDNSGDMYAKINGKDTIVLAIYKSSTAGTSSVSNEIKATCKELKKEYKGLTFTSIMDQGDYIRIIISSVFSNLFWGAILAIIVLFLFLKDIRPTIVVAFSIPLSVLFAILVMYFTGITMNIISLSGLALGIGMLVDNSIVVIENIYRIRSRGVPAARSAVAGANQVAGAIFASTLTTVCVFLPIVFTNGLSRQILQDMSLTITYSLMASLIIALTVVPTLGSTLLKKDIGREHKLFDKVMDYYESALRFCLRFKIVPLGLSIVLLALCVARVFSTGIVIIPEMSSYQMSANMEMPADTDAAEDYELCDEISKKIEKIEGVDTVGSLQSTTLGLGSTNTKSYEIMILLDHKYATKNHSIAKKIEKILAGYDQLENCSVSESIMDVSQILGSGLTVNIIGEDEEKLLEISDDIVKKIKKIKGFTDISNGQEDADTELVLNIDKDKAIEQNLTVGQIYQALYDKLTSEKDATTITIDEQNYDVTIVDERDSLTKDNLLNFEISSTKMGDDGTEENIKVKLSDIATVEEKEALSSIAHENGVTVMSVTASADDGYNTTLLTRKLEDALESYEVPDGYRVEIAGETETVSEMVKNMLLMMLVAIILIYLIMVSQFSNFLSPFIVMFTIPLAFTGGFLALMFTGQELSLLSMMGFLILSGVVVNNGIVFIDYTNQLRLAGAEKKEALVDTGRTRMRPILMTAMTTILGMSIMALSHGEAAEMGRGMAIVTIGGLAYATLMTLFIVPVLYDLFYRKDIVSVDIGEEIGDDF